jgi:signal transduction histidine kinase
VEEHGGVIRAENVLGPGEQAVRVQGARFRIELPLAMKEEVARV